MMADARKRTKTVAEINEKLRRGEAIVLTADELKSKVRAGRVLTLADVDVVTTATHGVMSGTAVAFSIPVTGRGVFTSAAGVWLNGVPGQPGPAPNENLGTVDMVVMGTAASRDNPRYGAGHLFRDLVERKPVQVEVLATDGKRVSREVTLDDVPFARMYSMRNGFKSYMAFGNFKDEAPVRTIFSYRPMTPATGISVIGAGEVNPIQNDPDLRTIGVGTLALVNDAPGIVVGSGTVSYPDRPNLSLAADLFDMNPEYMGGVVNSHSVEILNAVSIPIPVLDDGVLAGLTGALDERLPLPVADVHDRVPFAQITYGDVWQGTDADVTMHAPGTGCGPDCAGVRGCPVDAIDWVAKRIDTRRCTRCGACAVQCTHGTFSMNLGSVRIGDRTVPITYRTSDRVRATALMRSLKDKLIRGEVRIAEKVMDIRIRTGKH